MRPRIDFNRSERQGEKPKREGMSRQHLTLIRQCPCVRCGSYPSQAHHLLRTGEHGTSRRSSDQWAVPLCKTHHDELHHYGDEDAWFALRQQDGRAIAKSLWAKRGDYDAMLRVCERAVWRGAFKASL